MAALGAVDVKRHIKTNLIVHIHIAGNHLVVLRKMFLQGFFAGNKATFTVGERNLISGAHFHACQPWRLVAHELGEGILGLVATNSIKGKVQSFSVRSTILPYRKKTKLHQCLEAVANTEHQTVIHVKQAFNGFIETFVSKERSDVFTGAVRFIPEKEKPPGARAFVHLEGLFSMASMKVAQNER